MTSSAQRTPKTGRQSLFFQDLATPVSSRSGKFSSPGQAAAFSSPWKGGSSRTDLPPPPVFTLDDRVEFSPEPGFTDFSPSPETKSGSKTGPMLDFSPAPSKSKWSEPSTSYSFLKLQNSHLGAAGSNWWSSPKNDSSENTVERGIGYPVEGVVQPGSLITLTTPKEVDWPELPKKMFPSGTLDEGEWVTVYGFSPADTNLVLREFEKCGIILKHIPGPNNSNWMHILYQKEEDSRRALGKNGTQVNGVLIVGVKRPHPSLLPTLEDPVHKRAPPPPPARTLLLRLPRPPLPDLPPHKPPAPSALASPSTSLSSRLMDFVFGV